MKLTFLGTRGNIDPHSERHDRHTATAISYYGKRVVIDCGEDWRDAVGGWDAEAIVVTHAHPDHAGGLRDGAPCPVYATAESWERMEGFDVEARETMPLREPVVIAGITFEAFPVEHSTRAPAVGYRITAGEVTIFYVPDVAWIKDREAALRGAKVYVGDGATITRSMVRKQDDKLIGHVPLRTQLTWCQKEGVPRAIFTHCGSAIVKKEPGEVREKVEPLAEEREVEVEIAHDGMEVVLR